jgi:cytochrome c
VYRLVALLSLLLLSSMILSALPDAANSAQMKGGDPKSSPVAAGLGKADFENNCGACHPVVSGQNGYGPGLFGVVGRRAGTATGYAYSPSLVEAGTKRVVWTDKTLFQFLANPSAFLALKIGHPTFTPMVGGFPDEALRRSVIEYLNTLK